MYYSLVCGIGVVLCLLLRLYFILPNARTARPRTRRPRIGPSSTAVFLGSGGHTSEALMLMSSLDFGRYFPRTYIISQGDILSAQKAIALESSCAPGTPYRFLTIPRARHVHQTLLTTPLTAAWSLLACVYHVTLSPLLSGTKFADVVILNGPGTCFVLCIASYLNKFLGLPSPRLMYIESFARVHSLSLSGRLLRPFVDRFVVQWADLLKDGKRGECRGWLV